MITIRQTLNRDCWAADLGDGRSVHFGTERRAVGRGWMTLPYARVQQAGHTIDEWDATRIGIREYLADLGISWPRWDAPPMIMNGAIA